MTETEDFSDLDFDIGRHSEALPKFAELEIAGPSIKAGLRAREIVTVRVPSGNFRIGVTQDAEAEESMERDNGCAFLAVIHEADGDSEAQLVRDDVERYFLRHFPGRILKRPEEGLSSPAGSLVYVACYG
jgi:hypothetical protein